MDNNYGQYMPQQPMAPQQPAGGNKKTGIIISLIVYILVIGGGIAALLVMMNSKKKDYDELKTQYDEVEGHYNANNNLYLDIVAEQTSLEAQVEGLNNEIQTVTDNYNTLYDELMNQTPSATTTTTPSTNPISSTGNYDGTYYFVGATNGSEWLSAEDFQDQGYDVSAFGIDIQGNVANIVGGEFLGYSSFIPATITIYDDGTVMIDDTESIIYGEYDNGTISIEEDGITLVFEK